MKKETTLKEVIDYIRYAKIGDLIFRRSLMNFSKDGGSCFSNGTRSTVDNYRNYLTHAGYLKIHSRGVYKYMKEIPENLTYRQLIHEAYPDSEWTQIKKSKKVIPIDLDDAIETLLFDMADELPYVKKLSENKFLCEQHHNVGQYLRNDWGLWSGSKLQTWFKERGIHHADDMSSIILTSFWRTVHEKDINLEEQIKHYRDFWEENCPDVNKGIL
ncbi:MAG: DUF6794 domain-containing protein [Clostridia bacterium]